MTSKLDKITVFRQIILKELVTEESKKAKVLQLNQEMDEIDGMLNEFEERKNKALTEASLKGADQKQIAQFRQQFDLEGSKYHMRRDDIMMQLGEADSIVVGEEIIIGSVEGPYELKVGETLTAATSSEIIITDGIITEIR